MSLPITCLLQLITVYPASSPPTPEGVISNLNPGACLVVCMCLNVYFASLQRNPKLYLCLLRPCRCPCCPLGVQVLLWASCPNSQLPVRRMENSLLAAAGGAKNTSRIHRHCSQRQTKPVEVELRRRGTWMSSAHRPGTA